MNLWFRVLWLFLSAPFRARIEAPFGISRLKFRVWPLDLDTNLHLNNGRYLTIADTPVVTRQRFSWDSFP